MSTEVKGRRRHRLLLGLIPIVVTAALPLHGTLTGRADVGHELGALPGWVSRLPHAPGGIYDLPDSVLQQDGYTILQPSHIFTIPDGGVDIVYDVQGNETHFPVAPASFHPLSAPAWELALYHFDRPRSTDPAEQARWRGRAAAYTYTVPVTRLLIPGRVQISAGVPAANAAKDPTHSGWDAEYDGQHQFTAAQMYWTEPTWTPCNPNAIWAATIWPGLENPGGTIVTQDGTLTNNIPGGVSWSHQVWYATNPPQFAIPLPLTIPAGHNVYADVSHEANSTVSSYAVQDQTTGVYATHSDTAALTTFWAYWDIERPEETITKNGTKTTVIPDMPRFSSFNNRGYWLVDTNGSSGGIGDFVKTTGATEMIGTNTNQPIIAATSGLINSGSSWDTFTEMPIASVCS